MISLNINNRAELAHFLLILGLITTAIGLPLSPALMSIGQMVVLASWFISGNYKESLQRLLKHTPSLLLMGIFIAHVVGMANTSNLHAGLDDLRIKLPLLILPFVMGSIKPISNKEFHLIVRFFLAAVFIGVCYSLYIYVTQYNTLNDIREISKIISHIRFSLEVVLCIAYCILYSIKPNINKNTWTRVLFLIVALLFISYIVILQSFTGFLALGLMGLLLVLNSNFWNKKTVLLTLLVAGLITGKLSWDIYKAFQTQKLKENIASLPKTNINGNVYEPLKNSNMQENGYRIYATLSNIELETNWPKYSKRHIDSLDKKHNPIKFTLIRYLSSKGLTKDSLGLSKLNQQDIINIEKGDANYLLLRLNPFAKRVHEFAWELSNKEYLDINGLSLLLKLELWKAGWNIFKNNWLIGVGTGDIEAEYQNYYTKTNSPLNAEWRKIAHCQYLSYGIYLGLIGGLFCIIAFVLAFIKSKKLHYFLPLVFFSIISLSMFTEDTLNTQAGVTLFAFFSALFFGSNLNFNDSLNNQNNEKQ